jgi:hypothetical protein
LYHAWPRAILSRKSLRAGSPFRRNLRVLYDSLHVAAIVSTFARVGAMLAITVEDE